jgi:2-succinyl-6-hydroxy-2,4-cyclohexadiene-1-carboxylate synthase
VPGSEKPETVVLLHGFAGTRRAWDGVMARLAERPCAALALDLPGHGGAAAVAGPITFSGCVSHVLAAAPPRFALCGYSLGGRVALQTALAAPARVTRLVLVSTSAGIEDEAERAARRRSEEELATMLEREPFEEFIERWRTQPLFAGEPAGAGELAREDQRRNTPRALAAALRGVGAGQMEPLWARLPELEMPVVIAVGDRDAKFRALAERMAPLIASCELVVVRGGHGLVLENPAGVAEVIAPSAANR